MRWYNFIIYIWLIIVAIGSACAGVLYEYGAERINDGYLGVVSIFSVFSHRVCGIAYFAMAVFTTVVRNQLANYRKSAPGSFMHFIVMQFFVLPIVPLITMSLENETLQVIISMVGLVYILSSVLVCILVYIPNRIYFNKRKSMFCR